MWCFPRGQVHSSTVPRFDSHICSLSVLALLLAAACSDTGQEADADVIGSDVQEAGTDLDALVEPPGVLFTDIDITENPNSVLSAIISIETVEPARCRVDLGLDAGYGVTTNPTEMGTTHEITVVGMRAEHDYHLRVVAELRTGRVQHSADYIFTTGSLPPDLPSYTVTVSDAAHVQPGVTIWGPGVSTAHSAEPNPYYLGVDAQGEVVWYFRVSGTLTHFTDRHLEMLPDGNLLIAIPQGFAVVTVGGDTIWELTPDRVGYSVFHHDVAALPGGGFLTLSDETKTVAVSWSDTPETLRGDVIVELSAAGEVTWQWSAFDHLDTNRAPTPLSRITASGSSSAIDWTHGNAVVYVESDNSILLSLRHQNWVIKISRATGEVLWRLGADGDFDLIHVELGDAWFYSLHAPELDDDGRIALYDNGNDRPGLPITALFSRAVIYQLDQVAMQAEQVWSYETEHYTRFLGDADLLENGNVLVTAGGPLHPDHPAQIIELTGDDPPDEVWRLEHGGAPIYRATRLTSFYVE